MTRSGRDRARYPARVETMYDPVWKRPRSIEESIEALSETAGAGGPAAATAEGAGRERPTSDISGRAVHARPIAGGTDLAVRIASGIERPSTLVDLGRVEALRVFERKGHRVLVGATVTHGRLSDGDELRDGARVLRMACGRVGSPQIRARGTVGGNLVNASPAADAVAALVALDATVHVRLGDGTASDVPAREFITGPGTCALGSCDLLESVSFDLPGEGARSVYLKAGQRNALAIAIVSVAAVYLPGEGRVRLALGSVAPTPVRAEAAEALFGDRWPGPRGDDGLFGEVAERAAGSTCCIDDVRATASYRRRLTRVLTERALREVCRRS
ncbi:MAG: xanthine dehydrogenase family protein subunit M [Candidatus Eisenbacteria bacterium]|nr:xanthine dehydrogenase family protein subunit M [Candidatus Eisenbacteria bacterium]